METIHSSGAALDLTDFGLPLYLLMKLIRAKKYLFVQEFTIFGLKVIMYLLSFVKIMPLFRLVLLQVTKSQRK